MSARNPLTLIAAIFLVACQSQPSPRQPDVPLTRSNVGAAFADHAIDSADANRSGKISRSEWIGAGGTSTSFDALDTNASGKLTRIEIREGASTDKFWATVSRTMDTGSNTPMTPQVFRNRASARLFAYEF